mmetsp:Transcript_83854/g.250257  ORF Transcript_83854/g.250257 Transcript_83854/m.250257 type:complete len:97 (-) Transcript_83854:462-752(-)
MSSWCVPCSAMRPRSMTTMRSASTTVLRRCAMTRHVAAVLWTYSAMEACTSASVFLSSAEVASSRTRMRGFRASARASAIRCRWPPERRTSPTMVW